MRDVPRIIAALLLAPGLAALACRSIETSRSPEPDPPTDGKLLLNLRIDRFGEGPAAGADHVAFTVDRVEVVHERLVDGRFALPARITVAYGPVELALWDPERKRPTYAGEFWLPPGRVQEVRVEVSDVRIVGPDGEPRAIGFGAVGALDAGSLRFRPPAGDPGVPIVSARTSAYELVVPAGPTGALHALPAGAWHLDEVLPGGAMEAPARFDFATDRILVKYAAGATQEQIAAFEERTGGATVWTSMTGLRAVRFPGADWWTIVSRLVDYRASELVGFATLDPVLRLAHHAPAVAADWAFDDAQHWLADVRVAPMGDGSTTAAWDIPGGTGSREVIVGIIDSGLDVNHPDMVNNLWVNLAELPADLVERCGLDLLAPVGSVDAVLDFDGDGVFTLHDLNAELEDGWLRDAVLDALDACGYPLSARAAGVPDVDGLFQAGDFTATFADGLDTDQNGFVDDFFGANFLAPECGALGLDPVQCDPWDVVPDELITLHAGAFPNPEAVPGVQHGTQMAGLLGAEGDNHRNISGVAWSVRIVEVRAGYIDTSPADPRDWEVISLPFDRILAAADYLIANGASIIVLEFSTGDSIPEDLAAWRDETIHKLTGEFEARDTALFVLAAGNDGADCDLEEIFCRSAENDATNVIRVAATTHDLYTGEMDGLAGYSNYGDATIDIAAPGDSREGYLPTLGPGFIYGGYLYDAAATSGANGTSSAIAVVGGVAALRIAACGDPVSGATLASELRAAAQDRTSALLCNGGTEPCVAAGAFLDAGAVLEACAP